MNTKGDIMQKITPFLWFHTEAEEAVKLYTSGFKNSKIGTIVRYDEAGARASGRPAGSVMTVGFRLDGMDFTAINGGPAFTFNESISFVINCETQKEIDHFWTRLSEGGDPKAQQCGWLKDRFGVSWQIVPTVLPRLLGDKNGAKGKRVMEAVLKMKKIVIADLEKAHASV